MSQNTTAIMNQNLTPVYAGLDIAKASLQLHLQSRSYDLSNTLAGHRQLLKRLAAVPGVQVICEATGGYERAVVAALHAAAIAVSVINPARVRQFARASGELAKTDPIDAAKLAAFGQAFSPQPTPPRTATEIKMAALVGRRAQLLELRVAESQRADTCAEPSLCKLFTAWLTQMEKQIAKVEALIDQLLAQQGTLAHQVQRLDEITGVGRLTALTVLAAMPELGTLNRRQAAAWPASVPITVTAANGPASVASAVDGPKCAAPFTWPPCRPVGAITSSSHFTTGSSRQANPPKSLSQRSCAN